MRPRQQSRRTTLWDERYSAPEYAYGKAPDQFLEHNFEAIPKGKVLSLAEGEGRNAVFLAKQGTGGGKSADAMTTQESLSVELNGLTFTHLVELERDVVEGSFHTGIGAVVQAIAAK